MTTDLSDGGASPQRIAGLPDRGIRAVYALVALAMVGFAGFYLGWHHVAQTLYVDLQVPWVISCGLAGLGIVGTAAGAWHIQMARRDDAREGQRWAHLVRTSDAYVTWREQTPSAPVRRRPGNKVAAK
jgi:hypothetical protein